MDLHELKKKKESLELQINELIYRFEKENNVDITSLYLGRKYDTMINESMWTATTHASLNKDDEYKQPEVKISITL